MEGFVARFPPLLLLVLVPAIFLACPAGAAEDPEALYRGGRFAEAEKAYAELDMDHPKDVRYRYNRGCAAYQNSDYQGARSAFSSVLRRSESKEVRLRAAYNLGNTAYKQGDYKSAAAYYSQAVFLDPSHGDAKYNLELALRALEKRKKEQEQAKSGEDKVKGEKSGEEASRGSESKKPESKKERQDGKRGDSKGAEGKKAQGEQKGGADEKGSSEQGSPEDLSGELKPLRGPTSPGEKGEAKKVAEGLSGIDRKKAEALLDNIKEDRSQYLRFLVPGDKRQGLVSGKDW